MKGIAEVKPSVPDKLVRVKYDPDAISVKEIVQIINTKTHYKASEPKPSGKSKLEKQ